jgi:hypothetical protein
MGKLSSLNKAIKTAKLGGTTAERMARAKDMGFDVDTSYRGMSQPYDEAKTGHLTWTTKDPEYANAYAYDLEGPTDYGIGSNIMPVNIKAEAPFDFGYRSQFTDVKYDNMLDRLRQGVGDSYKQGRIDRDLGVSLMDKIEDMRDAADDINDMKPVFEWWNNKPEMVEILKESGYDSLTAMEGMGNDVKTTALFDQSQIRSVNADFNPDLKDSANLMAGVGGAAVLGGAMAPQDADAAIMEGVAMQGLAADWINRRADKRNKWDKFKESILEPGLTIGTALASMPAQGLAGIGALAQGYGIDGAVNAMGRTGEAMTYMPRSEAGMESLQNVGQAADILGQSPPAQFIGGHINQGADWAADNIHPAAGAALKTLPEVIF